MFNVQKRHIHSGAKQMSGCLRLEMWMGSDCYIIGFLLGGDKNVLELMMVMTSCICEYTKGH